MKQAWVLEDDVQAHFLFKEVLQKDFNLKFLANLTELKEALKKDVPDILIADIILPGENFLDYFKAHNDRFRMFNTLIVSSLDDIQTLEHSFHLGALDYLTKPFNPNELIYKIRKMVGKPNNEGDLNFNDILFAVSNKKGIEIQFTPKEYQILKLIYTSPDHSTDKNAIQKVCWQSRITSPNTIDVHLYNLRRKIETLGYHLDYTPPKTYRLIKKTMESGELHNGN